MGFARVSALPVATGVLLLAAQAALAQTTPITIPDGSFESATPGICTPDPTNGVATWTTPQTGTIPGWQLTVNPTTYNGGTYLGWVPYFQVFNTASSQPDYMPSEDGTQHLTFYGGELFNNYPATFGWPAYGIIPNQTCQLTSTGITATTVAGATYTATIGVANPLWHTWGHCTSAYLESLGLGLQIATPTFELDILANGQVVASNTVVDPPANGQWTDLTTSWVANTSGQSIQIEAVASSFAEGQMGPGHPGMTEGPFNWTTSDASFDDARLSVTAPVPEPASLTLLALGSLGLLARRRRA